MKTTPPNAQPVLPCHRGLQGQPSFSLSRSLLRASSRSLLAALLLSALAAHAAVPVAAVPVAAVPVAAVPVAAVPVAAVPEEAAEVFPAPTTLQSEVESAATCVSHTVESLYRGIGYDHLVHIMNGCSRPVQCTVTTNVNPSAMAETVPAKERRTVVTFRGSPARSFTAHVTCQLK